MALILAAAGRDMHYTIETNGRGWFQVRVTNPGGGQLIVPAFRTWQEASDWIEDQHRQLADAMKRRTPGEVIQRGKRTRRNGPVFVPLLGSHVEVRFTSAPTPRPQW